MAPDPFAQSFDGLRYIEERPNICESSFDHISDHFDMFGQIVTEMNLGEWEDPVRFASYALAAIASAYGLWVKFGKRWVINVKSHVAAMSQLPAVVSSISEANLPRLSEKLEQLEHIVIHEFRPNGGSSMRDSLDRIEGQQILHSQQMDLILAPANVGVFQTFMDGKWKRPSRVLCRIMQRSEDELKDNRWLSWICDDERDEVSAHWHDAVKECRDFDVRTHVYNHRGEKILLSIKAYPLSGRRGEHYGFYGQVCIIE